MVPDRPYFFAPRLTVTGAAASSGFSKTTKSTGLRDRGADLNRGLGKSATPIVSAICSKSLKLVELFVERGADPSATFGPRPKTDVVRLAEEHGTPEIVSFLKDRVKRSGS